VTNLQLPATPAQITPDWLTGVLRTSGALSSTASVVSIDHTPVGEGVGMLSEIEFLGLTYEGDAADAPASVVAKFPTQNETNRGVAVHFNVYAREVRYFAELHDQSAAHGPKVHLSQMEGDEHFVILLEDLSDYRVGDQIVGATLDETQAAIDELAKMHASFWNKLEDEQYAWLPRFADSQNAANMHEGSKAGWDTTVEIFGAHVPKSIRNAKDAYLAAVPKMQAQLDQAPRTLVHGDFRMDNLFFAQDSSHYPMTFVDWQGPVRGRGIHDVAYLLGQSTQTEVRRNHERDLIQRYVNGLVTQGIDSYTFDEAWSDYRMAVLYIWVYATVIAGTLDPTNQRGNAWMSEMVKRNCVAIEDLGCLDLL
jgi:aminoglycoside/choline kinase family phosphotransferase